MNQYTFFGRKGLCYTEVSDFTDYQGIGHDPLYKRYDSVFSVVKKSVPENYQYFLATPEYRSNDDQIYWHIDSWNEYPVRLNDLTGQEYDRYKTIFDDTVNQYKSALNILSGEDLLIMAGALKYINEDRVYCCDGKVYLVAWGMTPDTRQHKVTGSVIHVFPYIKNYKITFDAGVYGTISKLDKSINKKAGTKLTQSDLPDVEVKDGWKFIGWIPEPLGQTVSSDITFTAKYEKEADIAPISIPEPPVDEPIKIKYFNCRFVSGNNGKISGKSDVKKEDGSILQSSDVPSVIPNKGYKFKGWDISPYQVIIDGDKVFTAQYEKVLPWYKKWWQKFVKFWTGKGCLKLLLWLLLFILICWLLSWLLRDCKGCIGRTSVNGVVPIDTITRSDGRVVDDNGYVRPVTGNDGVLPEDGVVVSPVLGDGGTEPPIVKRPGVPDVIGNRLFLFLEDENDNIESFAKDFKRAYPDDKYSIIGYDKEVKLLIVQIPDTERDAIRNTINKKIPNHKFIAFDEEIYELNVSGSNPVPGADKGWHLKAIHLKEGWSITKGCSGVKVAIVDDGIQSTHPMFKGRIVDAYNVFTKNNTLSVGDGHGTHTAGLAVGSDEYYSQGASGVAPKSKIMPVQVFDNGRCSLSALIAGIMYSIHHDADVVNISIGPSFNGLNVLPPGEQEKIARSYFNNEEKLWARVCKLAAQKKCILVFAAGNDAILSCIPPENRNASSIVVTAVDKNLNQTEFTNYGTGSDISAPGKDIYSSYLNSTFQSLDGTSMAAPIVTGTVALMKSIKKDLTVEQARNALYSTGSDVNGLVPPMVLVHKVLEATKKGDFKRIERKNPKNPTDGDSDENITETPSPCQNTPGNETDYDAIRRKIAEYKEKIRELEKLLPNN